MSSQIAEPTKVFVGPNYAFFEAKWKQLEAGGKGISWIWPPFFFGELWLAYRKMYTPAFLLAGVFLAEMLVKFHLNRDPTPGFLDFCIRILISLFGNFLYKRHVDQSIAAVLTAKPETTEADLAKAGGTSSNAVALLAIVYVAATVARIFLEPALRDKI